MERTRPPLGPEETQQVLRRAAELDREHGKPAVFATPRLDPADLERIAAESGLSIEAVRRALDEHTGGGLARPASPCTAKRAFDGPPGAIDARVTTALRRAGLSPVTTATHATEWEPAPGPLQSISRLLNVGGRGAWLGASVESSVYAIPGERTCAELRGHVRDMRLPAATGAGLLLAVPAVFAILVILAAGLAQGTSHGAALLVVAAIWALLTFTVASAVTRGRTRKLQRALERTLRGLDH